MQLEIWQPDAASACTPEGFALNLEETATAVSPDVDMVLQRECAFSIYKEVEDAAVAAYSEIAREGGVYLGVAGYIYDSGADDSTVTNQFWLFDPMGQRQMVYTKNKAASGLETLDTSEAEPPTVVDTPFGRISCVICNDGAFPSLVAEAGRLGADIILSPSYDPVTVLDTETPGILARACENGSAYLRFVKGGRSMVLDPYGRVSLDYSESMEKEENHIVTMEVPANRGVFALYPHVAGYLEWVVVALSVCVVVVYSLVPRVALHPSSYVSV
ncbi:hypothetical protein KIPB_000575 [Kipferlia bialata]|uniref:CN hydrolase domain-containing protein n=1 Tax=Kipferlia bialata TaxID=797122 RepID=A0A9K3GEM8_9EUKA|nr:hypothetical protein KIPB_000575 [Kipferlia bialata]|eukprot:g575.t1